jgi:16S rRNA (cytosine967-C5)-methyltransferase
VDNQRRLGRGVPTAVADVGQPPFDGRRERARFDRVVLDLPCTGTGTFRKHPELKWRVSEDEIGRLARRALRMLLGAAPLVAEGGLLVAITCSLEAEENEQVIARFLEQRPELRPLPSLGELLQPPVSKAFRGEGLVRIFPGGDHDGFSIHVLRREG